VRREDETVEELPLRLDAAVGQAVRSGAAVNEIKGAGVISIRTDRAQPEEALVFCHKLIGELVVPNSCMSTIRRMLGVLLVLISRVDAKLLSIALIGALRGFSALAHEHPEQMPVGARLGSVSFATSCQPQVQADFNRAVALLHSFWLDEAERTFM
jgi:hypothetical protein